MLSIVIPTYNREKILCDSISMLLSIVDCCSELLIMDQTLIHAPETLAALSKWDEKSQIRWIRLTKPSITASMNRGALEAKGDLILFLDDDIVPANNLIIAHQEAHEIEPDAWAVVGQVLQPEDWNRTSGGVEPLKLSKDQVLEKTADSANQDICLKQDLDFRFNGVFPIWVSNVMAGNLSVKRNKFIEVGGFDENFSPPVAYRFETEFARRILRKSGKIRFEPTGSIKHLRASRGGTRSKGNHLTSMSSIHGVGDYYYALRCGKGWDKWFYICRRPFLEVRTKFHLTHPWWIPVKFIGELRAFYQALILNKQGPKLMDVNIHG